MKLTIIYLILTVQNYAVPVEELKAVLSPIANAQIEVIDLANPQDSHDLYSLHYALVAAKVKSDPVIYLHAPFIGGLSGGKASHGIANVGIVGVEPRDTEVIAHELIHLLGVHHNTEPCNLMNEQPCGFEILDKDIKKAKRFIRKRR